jgi:hypothetical protein
MPSIALLGPKSRDFTKKTAKNRRNLFQLLEILWFPPDVVSAPERERRAPGRAQG